MARKAKAKTHDYKPYPEHDGLEVGCKVSWYFYRDRDKAETCSLAAKHNAMIQQSLGYDFGYCSPGSIEKVGDHDQERIGMFKVCLP